MNREIGEKWIEALPKYQQVSGFLGFGNERCCLGVLCDLAVEAGVIPQPHVFNDGIHVYASQVLTLPEAVVCWAEMNSFNGCYADGYAALSIDNDNGATFAEIAETIREHMEEL